MTQLEALYIADAVLESHAKNYGDDECSAASHKIKEIIRNYHRAAANRNIYRKALIVALDGKNIT